MTSRFATAAHLAGVLAWAEQSGQPPMTSVELARSVNTHPVVIRRLLADLQRAGIVHSRRGAGGGSSLARPAEQVNLRDIYDAVALEEPFLRCAPGADHTACCVGQDVHRWLEGVFDQAEEALKQRLAAVSLADLRARVASADGAAPGDQLPGQAGDVVQACVDEREGRLPR